MDSEDYATRKNKASLRRLRRKNYLQKRLNKKAKITNTSETQHCPFADITNITIPTRYSRSKVGNKGKLASQVTHTNRNYTPKHPFNINVASFHHNVPTLNAQPTSTQRSNIQMSLTKQHLICPSTWTNLTQPISSDNNTPTVNRYTIHSPLTMPHVLSHDNIQNNTQPPSSNDFQKAKRTRPNFHQQGVNLINKFSAVETDNPSSSTVNNQIPTNSTIDSDSLDVDTEEEEAFMAAHDPESNTSSSEDDINAMDGDPMLPNLEAGAFSINCIIYLQLLYFYLNLFLTHLYMYNR